MGETSAIEWTDATVNFWWGCTKVGPGCDHCYAETLDARFGPSHWGTGTLIRRDPAVIAALPAVTSDREARLIGALRVARKQRNKANG